MKLNQLKNPLLNLTFFFVWCSVISEYVIYVLHSEDFFLVSVLHVSLYFTILANLLIGLSVGAFLFSNRFPSLRLFSSAKFSTANLSYITIVAIVYNVLIRNTWNPEGIEIIIQEFLHVVNPLAFFAYWIVFIDTKALKYGDAVTFLLFPFVYLMITFFRGSLTGFYPYWFLDVGKMGWITVSAYSFGLFLVFLAFGLGYIFLGKRKSNL